MVRKNVRMSAPWRWRLVKQAPKDCPHSVWGIWDQAVMGWTLAGPEDRNAEWVHMEDLHPLVPEMIVEVQKWKDKS